MKKTLKQIRDEWAKRPMEVKSGPAEIEERFPKKGEIFAPDQECIVEGCFAPRFKGVPYCKEHHLQAIEEQAAEAEKLAKDKAKRENSNKWPEEQAMARVRSTNTVCSNCGIFLRYGERFVVLREKDKLPRKPQRLEQKYRVLCEHCK